MLIAHRLLIRADIYCYFLGYQGDGPNKASAYGLYGRFIFWWTCCLHLLPTLPRVFSSLCVDLVFTGHDDPGVSWRYFGQENTNLVITLGELLKYSQQVSTALLQQYPYFMAIIFPILAESANLTI